MTHDEPGPGQTYALQVRKAMAALREREPPVDPLVPHAQRDPWERGCGRVGQAGLPCSNQGRVTVQIRAAIFAASN